MNPLIHQRRDITNYNIYEIMRHIRLLPSLVKVVTDREHDLQQRMPPRFIDQTSKNMQSHQQYE